MIPVLKTTVSPPVLMSEELFGGQNTVHIQHGDAIYTLRITRLGKLILTK